MENTTEKVLVYGAFGLVGVMAFLMILKLTGVI